MTDVSRAIQPVEKSGIRATSVSNSVTALSSLTKSVTDNAQVIHSPGFFDPTSSITTGTGGTGEALRSQQTANGGMCVSVSGTYTFGIVFDDIYPATNDLGLQWRPEPPVIRYRRTLPNSSTWVEWVYGVFSHTTDAGFMCFHDLDGVSAYKIEFDASHFMAHVGASANGEYHREPEIVPAATEVGGFYQISGFVTTTGATFNTLNWGTDQLKALVIGDSNSTGVVDPSTGSTDIDVGGVNSSLGGVDSQGASRAWWRQIFDHFVTMNNERLSLSNISLSGVPIATMTDATREAYIQTFFDGVPANVVDRFDKLTGWTTGTTAPFTVATRVYDVTWTPDVVLIALVSNDRELAAGTIAAGGDASDFNGPKFITDIVALVNAVKTAYPSAEVIFVNCNRADVGSETTHADAATALGPANLDHENDAKLHYFDILAEGTTDGSLHLDGLEHDATANALMARFDAILGSIQTKQSAFVPLYAAGGVF